MAFSDAIDNARSWAGQLSPRERRLLGILGSVFALLLIAVPMYVGVSSITSLEEENSEIRQVLQEIQLAEERLNRDKAERQAVDALYGRTAPSLGSFLEERAQEHNLPGLDVSDQPEVAIDGYTRRSVRVTLPRAPLRPLLEMLADIRNSNYPIAIERIQIDRGRSGEDQYLVKFAVNAYDREEASGGTE